MPQFTHATFYRMFSFHFTFLLQSIRKTIKRAVHHGAANGGGVYRPPPLPTPAAIYEEDDNELGKI